MAHSDLLARARRFVPPLSPKLHKGQAGRVGIVGGSADYSGAPYFAATSSLKAGADLAHVFCTPSAGAVIKTYSPDLIVHTVFDQATRQEPPSEEALEGLMKRLHVLVIGPGLGRDDYMQACGKRALTVARRLGLWVVLDADGLYAVTQDPSIVQGYAKAVLTPNIMEFKYLCDKMNIDSKANPETLCPDLAQALGHVTILQKGESDIIANGHPIAFLPSRARILKSTERGGLKRCGGQGDVLSGTTGLMVAWASLWLSGTYNDVTPTPPSSSDAPADLALLAAYAASTGTRLASRRAFDRLGREMQTSDVLGEVGRAFGEVVGEGAKVE